MELKTTDSEVEKLVADDDNGGINIIHNLQATSCAQYIKTQWIFQPSKETKFTHGFPTCHVTNITDD